MLIETLTLPNDDWLVATADRYWLSPSVGCSGMGCQVGDHHLQAVGHPDITRQLLAGCLHVGAQQAFKTAKPFAPAPTQPDPQIAYVYQLAGMYQTTHATPAAMRHAAQTFAQKGLTVLSERCLEVADEETGHDELALADLRALGLDAETLVQRLQPKAQMAMVALFWQYAVQAHPVKVFGYAYALERLALQHRRDCIEAIEAQLPGGVYATRCLRVHSAEGSDAAHVPESLAFMAGLSGADRTAIAIAVYETAKTMFTPVGYPGDDAVLAVIRQCDVQQPSFLSLAH